MTADEYEAAFHGIDLPQSVELYTGVKINDVPAFIEKEITILKTNNPERILSPIRYRLDRLLEIINERH